MKIPISEIVSAESKFALINKAVEKRVRAIGFETFDSRLKTFERAFGIAVALNDEERALLAQCSEIRNTFIHDQSSYRLFLDERGLLAAERKACMQHPIPITRDMGNAAIRLQAKICAGLYGAVIRQVLKVDTDEYRRTEEWIKSIGETISNITDLRLDHNTIRDARGLDEDLEQKWVPLVKSQAAAD